MNRRDALKALSGAALVGLPVDAAVPVSDRTRAIVFSLREGYEDAAFPEENRLHLLKTVKEMLAKVGMPDVEVFVTMGLDVKTVEG